MKVTTAMLADDAIDGNGKLYIHGGGWNTLLVPQFPAIIARLALVFVVEIEPNEMQIPHHITVDLVDDDFQPVGLKVAGVIQAAPSPIGSPGDSGYVSQVLRLEQQGVPRAGNYRFLIRRDGQAEPLASVPLYAKVIPQASMPT